MQPTVDTDTLHQRIAALEAQVAALQGQLAHAQQQGEALYRAILDGVNIAVHLHDITTGAFVDVNQRSEQLLGYRREELVGGTVEKILVDRAPYTLDAAAAHIARAVAGEHLRLVWPHRCSDGRELMAEVSLRRVSLAGVDLLMACVQDISERLERDQLREELIQRQAALLSEMSLPLIPLTDRVVVVPLIGSLDEQRTQALLETLLQGAARLGAETLLLDITGVPLIDTAGAGALIQIAQAVQLLGARVVLSGIRPEIAQTLVSLGADMRTMRTHSTLQAAIAQTLRAEQSAR
jgi:anti-anti-sigma factor